MAVISYLKNTLTRYSNKNTFKEKVKIVLTNRGFQSVAIYRLSNLFYKKKLGFISMILSRVIQVLYSIDIDYKAEIQEGLLIYHGTGLVIGSGVKIGKNCTVFHNTTFGIKFSKTNDGMPRIGDEVFIGCGSILLGKVEVESKSKIRAGTVLIK